MSLTMTRTRNQTTLTKLAERVATVHGELAYVEARLSGELPENLREGLARRRAELLVLREALYAVVRRHSPKLDPTSIGTLDRWLKPFGRGRVASQRYERSLGLAIEAES
jgi:hypothetical protein